MTVVQANVQAVQNLSNTVLISNGNESYNGQCIRVPRNSGQTFSHGSPITNGQGQTFQWNMALPEGSIINTATSCIKYKMKFTFNCKGTGTYSDSTPVLQTCNIDPNSATAQFLPPGRYSVRDTTLWCEAASIKANGIFDNKFAPPVAVCQFPMNSSCILNQSTVQYGNVSQTDDYIFQQRSIIQANLSEEYQAMFSSQFFDQDIDPVMKFIAGERQVDGTYKAAASGTPYTITVYKTFTIGLNMVNQLFDIKNKFYTLAFTRQLVQLSLKLQPYSMAKLFFTEDLCDKAQTGITELELLCYVKSSSTLPTDMNEKGAFVQMYHKYAMDTLTLNGGFQQSTAYLSSGHNSSNDVILCLNLPDTNEKDSTFLKQRYTLYNATQIINKLNCVAPYEEDEFVFFSGLNLERGSAAYRYFSENLEDPAMMKHEILRSVCALQQYQTSVSPSLNTLSKMMMKYAMVRINLEAYSTESTGDADVVYDGYYSVMQRILIKTAFKIYNQRENDPKEYDQSTNTNNPVNVRIANGLFNLYAFQTFDQAVKINPATGIMSITEDVKN